MILTSDLMQTQYWQRHLAWQCTWIAWQEAASDRAGGRHEAAGEPASATSPLRGCSRLADTSRHLQRHEEDAPRPPTAV